MDPISSCRIATSDAAAMISAVTPEQWGAESPCEGWDVRTLVSHMIGTCASFVAGLRKQTATDEAAPLDLGDNDPSTTFDRANAAMGDGSPMGLADDELAEAYQRAAAALMAEWEKPGALEQTVYLSFSEMPGAMAVKIVTADALLHTWDLAKALGRPHTLNTEISASTLEMMQQFYDPAQRGPGKAFGHAIPWPETAPAQERLVALSGRQP